MSLFLRSQLIPEIVENLIEILIFSSSYSGRRHDSEYLHSDEITFIEISRVCLFHRNIFHATNFMQIWPFIQMMNLQDEIEKLSLKHRQEISLTKYLELKWLN